MRTEHVKRNIDTNKAVRKTSLANCFFYVRLFPLVELLFRFVDKKEYQSKRRCLSMKHLLWVLLYVFSLLMQGFYFKKYFYWPL